MSIDLTKLDDQALRWEAIKASAWFENHLPTDSDYEARLLTSRYLFEETARRLGQPASAADADEFENRIRATSPRTTFELKLKSGNPDRYAPIRKDGEIIGYIRRSGGYTEARDIDGRIVWSDEIGLEKPFLDPIDFIPFELVGTLVAKTATFAAKTTGRLIVKSAGRVAGKEATTTAAKTVAVEASAALEKSAAKRLAEAPASATGKALGGTAGKTAVKVAAGEAPKLVFVEVGAGNLQASIALAKRGVKVIAVDPSVPAGAAIKELESLGGTFIQGALDDVATGTADHVFQYFPWRIREAGSTISGGTWRLISDTTRVLKPGGAAHFVTEHEATALALTADASKRGLRTVLTETTAGAAAPGAAGAGVPDFGVGLKVWLVNIYK